MSGEEAAISELVQYEVKNCYSSLFGGTYTLN